MRPVDNDLTSRRSLATVTVYSRTLSEDEFKKLIPLTPSESWQKGTPRTQNPSNVHPYTGMTFRSRLPRNAPPEDHLADVLTLVGPVKPQLRDYVSRATIEDPTLKALYTSLTLEAGDHALGLDIPTNVLADLSALGGGFGIEFEVVCQSDDGEDWPESGTSGRCSGPAVHYGIEPAGASQTDSNSITSVSVS
jgi:hypothetical protein